MNNFAIRRLNSTDSIEEITRMLHRAFAPMARLGANCQCADRSPSATREGMERGDCLVAVTDRGIVGTLTLRACDPFSAIGHYRKSGVASLHQFAVDPVCQGGGIGRSLLKVAAMWARMRQFSELALDAPAVALDVRAFLAHQGFKLVQFARLADQGHDSVILSKPVSPVLGMHPGVVRRPVEFVGAAQDEGRPARWLH
jgi:GNAT superfamily N-acetyltransferase